jgi:hypothetical protein
MIHLLKHLEHSKVQSRMRYIDHIQAYLECEWSSLLADIGGYILFDGS